MDTKLKRKPTRSCLLTLFALGVSLSFQHNAQAAPEDEMVVADIQAILVGGEPRSAPVSIDQLAIKRAAGGPPEAGQLGMRLVKGDTIKTGIGVEVNLVFTNPNNDERIEVFVLEKSKASISSLFGYYGSFWISGWGLFDTKTQYVRLGKRGTEFQMVVDERGSVDLTVLRGIVDVEQGQFQPPTPQAVLEDEFTEVAYQLPARGPLQSRAEVQGLHKVRIEKNKPIPQAQLLNKTEVERYVQRTNHLYIATMPMRLPKNIKPTTILISEADPEEDRRRAVETFNKARLDAILTPDAANTRKLGEVYKDFGAGQRSTGEFNKAVKQDPALVKDANFLISRSEAYREAGDLIAADRALKAASAQINTADADTVRSIKIASGNLSYDKAMNSIARGDKQAAAAQLSDSRAAYEAARSNAGSEDPVVTRNLNNVKLGINRTDPTATTGVGLDGTYRGKMDFPSAGLTGDATLVITGNRFSLTHCKGSFKGTIEPKKTPTGPAYDFVFETHAPVAKLTLVFTGTNTERIITNAPAESHTFKFTQNAASTGMRCIQTGRIVNRSVWH